MDWNQFNGVLRVGLGIGGGWLVSHGVLSAGQWSTLSPYVFSAIGSAVALGSVLWSFRANHPSAIVAKADAIKAKGNV